MRTYLFIALFFATLTATRADEMINDIAAVVGEIPITMLDVEKELSHKKPDTRRDSRNKESRALDALIEKAIIESVMKEEVISVSDAQVDAIIKKSMADNGIKDEKAFEQVLMQQIHMSLESYKDEIMNNLKIQQISQLKISVPTPSPEEIRSWYNQHRGEIGNRYLLRIIKKSFNPNNPKEELAVNQLMNKAREEAVANFSKAAAQYSDDASAAKGGLLGWLRLDELAAKDPMLANIVYKLGAGEVSIVFVSQGSYAFVKADALEPVSVEDSAPFIAQRLFRDKQTQAFADWMKNKRKTTPIKIFLKNYQGL